MKMAGDRDSEKEKKGTRRRRISSDVDSDDEGRSKRHRSTESKSERSNKGGGRGREEKSRRSRSHKHSKRHSSKEKNSEGMHKSSHAKDGGDHLGVEFSELSNDDYYSKNNEFATWLKEERALFFSDLSSELARQLFSEFIVDWNRHKLETKYYKGISAGPRTAHKWKIKS
ncbi:hypothetical protein Dimus_020983 [Dionaea muscipula]